MGVHEDRIALEGVIEAAPVALVVVTVDLDVLLWNAAAEALFGWSAGEVIGRPLPTVPPEREEEFQHHVAALQGGHSIRTDTWRRRKDGATVEVRVTAAPLMGAASRLLGWVVSYADLTEQRLAEGALEARSGELEAIFAAFPDLYFWFGPDNRILAQRAGRRQDLFMDPVRFVGLRPRDYLPRDAGLEIEAAADRARRTGEVQAIEYMLPIEGRETYFEARFAALAGGRVISIVRNITDLKHTERDLRESFDLLKGVVENTPDAIFLKDREGRYRMVNSATADWMGGYAPEEVVGRRDDELLGEPVWSRIVAQDLPVLRDGITRRYEEALPSPGGERHLLTTKSALRDAEGRVTGIIGVSHDVTEQRRLEAQFRQSQKMEAIGRLAGGIAHDFNNLLTVILSSGELLLRRIGEGDDRRDEVQQIVEAAERAGALTRQLLAFSRRRVLEPKVVDLTAVIESAERMLRRLIGEHIRLETLTEARCHVRADPGQLEQILVNLVVNARDAMPDGGILWLFTRRRTVPEGVGLADEGPPAGEVVELEVRDTGTGMDAETLARIYEPFFTTKGPGEGSGLGLTTVYGIVQQLGGTIEAESAPGEGTRFVIRLPEEAAEADAEEAAAESPARGDETILVVEDDEQVRELVHRTLSDRGYRVVAAGGGEEALRRLEEVAPPLHLLLTDVVMPGMNGREVAEAVQHRRPEARVVFMTGYSDDLALDRRILELGEPLIHKPFTGEQLARAVREALDR